MFYLSDASDDEKHAAVMDRLQELPARLPSADLKRHVLKVSNDILAFLDEWNRNEPPSPTPETWNAAIEAGMQYSRRRMDAYSSQFSSTVLHLRHELAKRGLYDRELDSFADFPTNPIGVRFVGQHLGALARQLPDE